MAHWHPWPHEPAGLLEEGTTRVTTAKGFLVAGTTGLVEEQLTASMAKMNNPRILRVYLKNKTDFLSPLYITPLHIDTTIIVMFISCESFRNCMNHMVCKQLAEHKMSS